MSILHNQLVHPNVMERTSFKKKKKKSWKELRIDLVSTKCLNILLSLDLKGVDIFLFIGKVAGVEV